MLSDVSAVLPQVYEELRAIAQAHFHGEDDSHTLQPTVLVHEVYLRLAVSLGLEVGDRAHFVRLASKVMRQVLLDHARAKHAQKRDGGFQRITLTGLDADEADAVDAIDLEDALQRLALENPRRAELVELRFYGGLTMQEVAESTGVSVVTVKRDWRLAKAWLARELAVRGGEQ